MPDGTTLADVDRHVGAEVRRRRKSVGMSQKALADSIGVTFQQVQKYEKGTNRISASVLYVICGQLNCSPAELFPPMQTDGERSGGSATAVEGAQQMLSSYAAMNPAQRRAVLDLVRSMG